MKKITLIALALISFNFSFAQYALEFDPTSGSQSVQIPGITCPDEFTIEAWINFKGNYQSWQYPTILEFEGDAPFFGINDSGNLTLFGAITSFATIPLNQWTHIAVTYSSITLEANIYIDGVLDRSTTGSSSIDISGEGAGIAHNDGDEVFNGLIDDVRIWNDVRTDVEILSNMNTCLTGSEANLYAFYNFDEGNGTTVNDLTSNGFHGTLVNMDPLSDWVSYDSCETLSNDNPLNTLEVSLFPNPASNSISIQGLKTNTGFSIYNTLGAKVLEGNINVNENINIQALTNGFYLLKFENGNTLKFLKK